MIHACPACNGKVSEAAAACPHCGHPQKPQPGHKEVEVNVYKDAVPPAGRALTQEEKESVYLEHIGRKEEEYREQRAQNRLGCQAVLVVIALVAFFLWLGSLRW